MTLPSFVKKKPIHTEYKKIQEITNKCLNIYNIQLQCYQF